MKHAATKTLTIESALGPMLLAASEAGLTGIWFEGQKHFPPEAWQSNDASEDACVGADSVPDRLLREAAVQLGDYFAGRREDFDLPLQPEGTEFQVGVWDELLKIPYGRTVSYGELAGRLGNPAAVRAVAAAIGRNPVSIVIPCHRVVGANGSLTGYAGGLDRKQHLLSLESAQTVLAGH